MTLNIDKLLRKKGWTGEEVGKALVASLLYDIEHKQNKLMPNYKPLFTQADFNKMHGTLKTNKDAVEFAIYNELFYNLKEIYNRSLIYPQSFYHGYYRLYSYIEECFRAEEDAEIIGEFPLLVTASQYKKLKADAITEMENFKESFASLVVETIFHFIFMPKPPAPFEKAFNECSDEDVVNSRVLELLREKRPSEYYYGVLPDGRRSDEMTREEWNRAIDECFFSRHGLEIDGRPASDKETQQYYREKEIAKACELLYNGLDGIKAAYRKLHGEPMPELPPEVEEEVLKAVEVFTHSRCNTDKELRRKMPSAEYFRAEDFVYRYIIDPLNEKVKWYKIGKEPKWTKGSLLPDVTVFYKVLPDADAASKRNFRDLKTDFPKLFKLTEEYLKKHIPSAKTLKAPQYFKPFITWKELAELGFLNYHERIYSFENLQISEQLWRRIEDGNGDESIYRQIRQVNRGGVAIVQRPSSWKVDENGDYIFINPIRRFDKIDALPGKKDVIAAIHDNLICFALKWLYGFNALMLILGEVFGIDMKAARMDMEPFENQCRALNRYYYLLYAHVFGSFPERTRKRGILKECISPVDFEELKPKADNIQAVKNQLVYNGYSQLMFEDLKNLEELINKINGRGV